MSHEAKISDVGVESSDSCGAAGQHVGEAEAALVIAYAQLRISPN